MIFSPSLTGELALRSRPEAFLDAFRQRVEQGLLTGQPHPRSRYTVTGFAGDRLTFRAADWRAAFNLGLNEVELVLAPPDRLRYRIEYWRWARYALGLSAGIGAVLCVVLLSIDLPRYIEAHRNQTFTGVSVGGNVALAWGLALFWGLVWPWILIALHKPVVRRLFERIVAEVDADPVSGR